MDVTKTTFMVKGVSITENEVVFDYAENKKSAERSAKIGIIVGILTVWIVGLGIVAIVIGIIQLKEKPIVCLKRSSRYLSALSKQTGKPIVYKNLPPELKDYNDQVLDQQQISNKQITEPTQIEDKNTKFCGHCGNPHPLGTKFCSKCGAEF
ncbi:MAG: zinc ribbon domain-containing protein [Candidatus Heimdallarchaeota archaeon]